MCRRAQVDATEESALAGRFDVSGYPTIKVRRSGARQLSPPRRGRMRREAGQRAPDRSAPPQHCARTPPLRRCACASGPRGASAQAAAPRKKGLLCAAAARPAAPRVAHARPLRAHLAAARAPGAQIFRSGKAGEYNGPRQAAGIVSYMLDQASPGARKVSAAELATLRSALRDDAPESMVVLFVAKASDVEGSEGLFGAKPSALGEAFSSLASKLRESFTFAWSADAEAAAAAGAKAGSVAVLHSPLLAGGKSEPAAVFYDGAATAEALEAWLWPASLPRVGELTARTAPRYAAADAPLVRVALPTDWRSDAKGANYWLNRLRRVAAAHPALRFAAVKPSAPLAALADYGVDASPDFSVTAQHAGRKYAAAGKWDPKAPEESVAAFLKGLEDGTLEPHVKSGPLPEGGLENGVSVLVGKNFDAVGLDQDKGAAGCARMHQAPTE